MYISGGGFWKNSHLKAKRGFIQVCGLVNFEFAAQNNFVENYFQTCMKKSGACA